MGKNGIQVGDVVVGTQIPGVFTVVERTGDIVVIESDRGLRMRVIAKSVRKLEGTTPAPKDG